MSNDQKAHINGCEAVYPGIGPNDNVMYGLTKREYFAAAALQGLLAADIDPGRYTASDYAVEARIHADALLEALTAVPSQGSLYEPRTPHKDLRVAGCKCDGCHAI